MKSLETYHLMSFYLTVPFNFFLGTLFEQHLASPIGRQPHEEHDCIVYTFKHVHNFSLVLYSF